jgi:CDP-diacylglycerol--glycerol-3-phosphate 3-phosphatidyltransferase
MKRLVDEIRLVVRDVVRGIAKPLDRLSGGRVTPNMVTWFGFAMHLPIAYLIAQGELLWGGALLIVFGLFDTLDGELARLQKRVSDQGGFLDAATDRFKEVLLYSGVAYYFTTTAYPEYAVWAVAACGASICVSFVKAKGEAIVAASGKEIPYHELNRMFSGGLFPFEVRMAVLVAGLLSGQLVWAVAAIAVCSAFTALQRVVIISRRIT